MTVGLGTTVAGSFLADPSTTIAIHSLADRFERQVKDAFREAVTALKLTIDLDDLAYAIEIGDRSWIMRQATRLSSAGFDQELKKYRDTLDEIFGRAANLAIASAFIVGFDFTFDLFNPRAVDWANDRAGDLITNVTDEVVDAVSEIVSTGWTEGITVPDQARVIRSVIGLTPGHAAAVRRYATEQMARGIRSDLVAHNVDLYANRLLSNRASVIARTENITAAMAGQYELWLQLADEGILQRGRTWVEWIVTEDDRLCPLCAPMEGQRVRLGSRFTSRWRGFPDGASPSPPRRNLRPDPLSQKRDKLGRFTKAAADLKLLAQAHYVFHPPLHPQCRCSLRLAFDD